MSSYKRIAINMQAQIIAFIVNIGINLWLTPFITQQVGKEVYGFVNLAFQFTGYITIITTAMNAMLGRYVTMKLAEKDYRSASVYFSTVTIANAVISAVLILPVVSLILFLDKIIRIPVQYMADVKLLWIFIFGIFLISLVFESYGVAMFACNRIDVSAKRNIENYILKALILIGMYHFFVPKIWFIGLATFISGLYIVFTNVMFKRKYLKELVLDKALFRINTAKEIITLGVWNSINLLSQNLISGLDMMITNIFISAGAMTLMGFAKSIPVYISSMITMVAGSFSPTMMKEYATLDALSFVKKVNSYMRICGFICIVPVVGFMVFGYDFFHLWLYMLSSKEILTIQILSVMIMSQTVITVYVTPLFTINTITCKLTIPVLVNFLVGVGNVAGTMLLLKFTDLGIYSVQIVSSTLLLLKVGVFNPIYAAHVLELKWNAFYTTIVQGIVTAAVISVLFIAIRSRVHINNWLQFLIVVAVSGVAGYLINFMMALNRSEKKLIWNKLITGMKRK